MRGEWGSVADERVGGGTLASLAPRARAPDVGGPALLVIGDVVSLRHQLRLVHARAERGSASERSHR